MILKNKVSLDDILKTEYDGFKWKQKWRNHFSRSLSSVPDLHGSSARDQHHAENGGPNLGGECSMAGSPGADTDSSVGEEGAHGGLIGHAAAAALTRVYAAHSLPGHIWSLNGELL